MKIFKHFYLYTLLIMPIFLISCNITDDLISSNTSTTQLFVLQSTQNSDSCLITYDKDLNYITKNVIDARSLDQISYKNENTVLVAPRISTGLNTTLWGFNLDDNSQNTYSVNSSNFPIGTLASDNDYIYSIKSENSKLNIYRSSKDFRAISLGSINSSHIPLFAAADNKNLYIASYSILEDHSTSISSIYVVNKLSLMVTNKIDLDGTVSSFLLNGNNLFVLLKNNSMSINVYNTNDMTNTSTLLIEKPIVTQGSSMYFYKNMLYISIFDYYLQGHQNDALIRFNPKTNEINRFNTIEPIETFSISESMLYGKSGDKIYSYKINKDLLTKYATINSAKQFDDSSYYFGGMFIK